MPDETTNEMWRRRQFEIADAPNPGEPPDVGSDM
jgi:hypothetical protein